VTLRPGLFELDYCFSIGDGREEVTVLEIGRRTVGEDGGELLAQELLGLPRSTLHGKARGLGVATDSLLPLMCSKEGLTMDLVRRWHDTLGTYVAFFLRLVDNLGQLLIDYIGWGWER
jgi:plasmid maintenance system antidote protein VapI